MGGASPSDDDDPDTGILLHEEFSGRVPVEELERALKSGATVVSPRRGRGDRASRWMEEALQNSSTVVRKVDGDTLRLGVDEVPRPSRPPSERTPAAERLAAAPGAPTVRRKPVAAVVEIEPTDAEVSETREPTGSSGDLRPQATDPGWIAVQASLWGLFVSGMLGLSTLVLFFVLV
ncbi:MAG: hypothetical protein AAF602_00450 [Myxococcota bacterium]